MEVVCYVVLDVDRTCQDRDTAFRFAKFHRTKSTRVSIALKTSQSCRLFPSSSLSVYLLYCPFARKGSHAGQTSNVRESPFEAPTACSVDSRRYGTLTLLLDEVFETDRSRFIDTPPGPSGRRGPDHEARRLYNTFQGRIGALLNGRIVGVCFDFRYVFVFGLHIDLRERESKRAIEGRQDCCCVESAKET